MRGLEESGDTLSHLGYNARDRIGHAWQGFVDFAMRENVLEVAIGLMIGQAFTKVVTSFVSDVILPIISLLPFIHRNLDEKFAVLKQGPNFDSERGYNTLDQARSDGALVMAYGAFLNNIISFLGVGIVLYGLAHFYVLISHDGSMIKRMVKCKYCKKWINRKAHRCVNCSSWQDGREEIRPSSSESEGN
ncbi:putative ion channel [Talaromyces proteolyticus]|uniref:Ion channel n=1 Tax=Talaromyces proteolyticus TaxID=1131652 RepID=A0AAD4L1M8_9EURO|nr:putative ion channel [Talaromyces proteolyticus]KAH8703981.1 putative ion channel [Talaromyces proteolyticus]